MSNRVYGNDMLRAWRKEIERAESLVKNWREVPDEEYRVVLDPDDFLDLCAGKWGEDKP